MAVLHSPVPQHDLNEFVKLIPALRRQIEEGIAVVAKVRAKCSDSDINTASGISFLELKNHLLLSYLQSMTLLMLKKTSGVSIANDPATLRLVEIRTVLERMRPIEIKLKYHIDKSIKAASNDAGKSSSSSSDPLSFRPNPDQLIATNNGDEDDDDDDADEEADEEDGGKSRKKPGNLYVPPKMAAVPYNFDETPKDRAQKQADRDKKRALHSSIMQELRQEYYDEPEEIHDRDIFRVKSDKRAKEREAYEEKTMSRLAVSKKDKDRAKRVTTMNSLKYLTDFSDFRGMGGGGGGDDDGGGGSGGISMTKKRKSTAGQKKGKKSKKFKKRR
ncbi:putative Neuroguidin-B [Hypsibius exemplaris]|uniref:Neuroguidin-B n=1 Tax=Hypsibius exemplaris TaxID=2072580 RepID=A0A1W0WF51_HYPEX|nr:putative Neuroguidin-B [Hypsibius exemplaris]